MHQESSFNIVTHSCPRNYGLEVVIINFEFFPIRIFIIAPYRSHRNKKNLRGPERAYKIHNIQYNLYLYFEKSEKVK